MKLMDEALQSHSCVISVMGAHANEGSETIFVRKMQDIDKTGTNVLVDEVSKGASPRSSGYMCVFRTKPATDSDRKRPLIPIDSGHPFRRKAATPS